MRVARPELNLAEKLYFPAILSGMALTLRHFLKTLFLLLFGRKKKNPPLTEMTPQGRVTMQYPEEKWTMPEGYRGAPVLVRDEEGRTKCVSCQLCEFICPPRAIRIDPAEIPPDRRYSHVEKEPRGFEIDMLRCIYCGLCEEVCPEEAIFLKKDIPILTGRSRREMIHDKEKLLNLGGLLKRPVRKWDGK